MADKIISRQAGRIFRKKAPPGTPPGTLTADPDAPHPAISVLAFGPEQFEEADVGDPSDLKRYLDRYPVTWVNVDGLGDTEVLKKLGDLFDLHPLALEDVLNVHQRPKLEEYGEQLFMVFRMTALMGEGLFTEQISLFLGDGFVLTFQERAGDCLDPVRDRLRKSKGRIRKMGPDYLAYSLLDAVIDGYFPVLELYGEMLEALEDEVFENPSRGNISRIHRIKRDLLTFRRSVWPLREAASSLFRDETPLITDETRMYLRDCYDHTIQVIDMVETYRELTSGLMEGYLSSISNKMNEVMKVLTVIATIFIPLTFLAGIYGMNFNQEASPWNMPELNWYWGYPFFWGITVTLGVLMILLFRRKGWLG